MKPVNEMTAKEFQAEMLVWAEAYGFNFIEYRDGVFSVECEDGRVIEAESKPRCLKLYGSRNSTADCGPVAIRWCMVAVHRAQLLEPWNVPQLNSAPVTRRGFFLWRCAVGESEEARTTGGSRGFFGFQWGTCDGEGTHREYFSPHVSV